MSELNSETARRSRSARRGALNDKFIEEKIWNEMDIEEYFKKDSLLNILIQQFSILKQYEEQK